MITCQCAEAMPTYASQSSYLTPIPSANIERGVIPLDSLPADWWNWLWNNITLNEARIVQFINSVFSEINSVLSAAGVTPSTASTTDLKTAIQKLAATVATSAVPGSVLSSTLSGKLRVIADGTASINDLGTPDQLETTSKEVVSAINEVLALAQGKAPTSHASSDTTYGVGTTQQYGHVKVTEGCGLAISCGTISLNAPGYNCTGTVTAVCYNGSKYTPSGGVVNLGNAPSSFPGYGTAICTLNGNLCCASSAGTSNLVARADHVHKMPNVFCCGGGTVKIAPDVVTLCTNCTALCVCDQVGNYSSEVRTKLRGTRCSVAACWNLTTTPDGRIVCGTAWGSDVNCMHMAYVPMGCYSFDTLFACLGLDRNCRVMGAGFRMNNCVLLHISCCNDIHVTLTANPFPESGRCIISTQYSGSTYCMGGILVW